MSVPKIPGNKTLTAIAAAFVCSLSLLACSVDVKDHNNGDNSKVDIQTPMGGIHVDEEADVRDTGLPLYPGARQKQKTDDDSKSANVNISGFGYGVKVIALEYESDDPPGKIIAYYENQLKKFGDVLQCHTTGHHVNYDGNWGDHDSHKSRDLKCEAGTGSTVELKVGTQDNQHVVSVEPKGKGSDFSLVFVRTHGKDAI